jgi:hypothetical protein
MITILILFHQSGYRTFKDFYLKFLAVHLRGCFPRLTSYSRFVGTMPSLIIPLFGYLRSLYGKCTGVSFIDSTALAVCVNRRIPQHRVFDGVAMRGKTSVGWFYGFKVHLVCNEHGELLNFGVTAGNVDDRVPAPSLVKGLHGKIVADKGYVSQKLFERLHDEFGVHLVTRAKRNMKNKLQTLHDKLLLRRRAIIETVIDQLKNISQIEHTRHRSGRNFIINIICGLIAYCHQPKKPSIDIGSFNIPAA